MAIPAIKVPIVDPNTISNKSSSDLDSYPFNRVFFTFQEENLKVTFCIGVFWNKEIDKYYVEIFVKKFKSNEQKIALTDTKIFLKCKFSGFGIYYCAVSKSYLTSFSIHHSFSFKNSDSVEASFEIIPFLPFKLEENDRLIPFLAISHSPVIPCIQYYDTEWPVISYIRQILTENDGTISYPHLDMSHDCYSNGIQDIDSLNDDLNNYFINQIFGVTKNICDELGAEFQAIYGIPQTVYTNLTKVKLNSDAKFLIYALPPEFQSDIPTIISDDFADLNPFHLCSLIRKEIDDEYYFLTIYSPSLNKFYTVADGNISLIDSKPGCYADEYIISALYIRLNVLDAFRFYSPSLNFLPRFNLVDVYEVKQNLYLNNFFSNEDYRTEFLPKKRERSDDLDNEPDVVLFPYDPNNNIFPSIPLTCASSKSILKLHINSEIKKFQLIWYYCPSQDSQFYTYLPVIVDLTNTDFIKIPEEFDLIHVSSNYLTTPYKNTDILPTGPMIMFRCKKLVRFMKPISFSFGIRVASGIMNQFTQPPIYLYSDKNTLFDKIDDIKKRRGIEKCDCYIRTYVKGNKIAWEKLPEDKEKINIFFQSKYFSFTNHNFIQFFIELQ